VRQLEHPLELIAIVASSIIAAGALVGALVFVAGALAGIIEF
jgi:hypothetical protein